MDDFDPNTLMLTDTYNLTIDTYGDFYAVIDRIDLEMVRTITNGNAWCLKPDRNTSYARSHITVRGRRIGVYLHRAVMFATKIPPLTEQHTIVDHIDGDGLNCRRSNLRWSTPKDNAKNVGSYRANLDMFQELWYDRNKK